MKHYIESFGKASLCLFILLATSMASVYGAGTTELDPVDYIKPIIGTNGTKRCGRTIPGPYVPFGMVQLSPDTRTLGWDACAGYHHSDSSILGFSHTHLSGTGIGDLGDILGEDSTKQIPHGKIHTPLVEHEGYLYFSTQCSWG